MPKCYFNEFEIVTVFIGVHKNTWRDASEGGHDFIELYSLRNFIAISIFWPINLLILTKEVLQSSKSNF